MNDTLLEEEKKLLTNNQIDDKNAWTLVGYLCWILPVAISWSIVLGLGGLDKAKLPDSIESILFASCVLSIFNVFLYPLIWGAFGLASKFFFDKKFSNPVSVVFSFLLSVVILLATS